MSAHYFPRLYVGDTTGVRRDGWHITAKIGILVAGQMLNAAAVTLNKMLLSSELFMAVLVSIMLNRGGATGNVVADRDASDK